MRLSKFLSLSVAMSRNQAKFFIRKGRLSVDGTVVTDPEFDLVESNRVVFDGKPIVMAGFQYIVLHKPLSYACVAKGSEPPSVLTLLNADSDERYFYYANVLGPNATGLVLLSDDARWTQRIKRRLLKKLRVYRVGIREPLGDDGFQAAREALLALTADSAASVTDLQRRDDRTLVVTMGHAGMDSIRDRFASVGVAIETLHLQQLGRLSLGDVAEGEYLQLGEDDVKI